jgi:3-hydroxymyristoyl/3-hydroxydecanoyl-(acyl carrier protein) dehydratase
MTTYQVPPDHPSFDGHFPGHPILPGVVLLAEALAAIESATATTATAWTLDAVKFLSPVTPGTALAITHAVQPHGGVRFEIRAGERLVASGSLSRTSP